jgi:hypothetical protein
MQLDEFVNGLFAQSMAAVAASPTAGTPMDEMVARFTKYLKTHPQEDFHHEDRLQTEGYFTRALDRLAKLGAAPPWPS